MGQLISIDPDGTLAANSDAKVASQKATKTAIGTAQSASLPLHGKADTAGAADTAVTLAAGTDRTKLDGIAFQLKGSILLQEIQPISTNGGTFTSGAWQQRVLNTLTLDSGGNATLVANQFSLVAGTYDLEAVAPAANCDQHQIRLLNVTVGAPVCVGSSEFASPSGAQTNSILRTRLVITGTNTYQIEHECTTTAASFGLGVSNGFSPSVFTQVWIRREL